MGARIFEIPVNLVKNGDTLWYANEEYPIVNVVRLRDCTTLNYLLGKDRSGYFNFENSRIVKLIDKQNEFNVPDPVVSPTIEFPNQINPVFLPVEEFKKQEVSDEEDVLGKDVEVGDVIWVNNNWATVTNVYKHPHSPANKVNVDYGNIKGLQVRLALTGIFSRKVRAAMETLNIQNAIEAQRILLQKLGQMLDLTQLVPLEGDKVLVGGSSVRVDKATVVKAARDEMKVAASKSAELIKKL